MGMMETMGLGTVGCPRDWFANIEKHEDPEVLIEDGSPVPKKKSRSGMFNHGQLREI